VRGTYPHPTPLTGAPRSAAGRVAGAPGGIAAAAHGVRPSEDPTGEVHVARCEVCGNDYDLAFEVITAGNHHVFDSFECAIHRLAPRCEHCGCTVIGHGSQVDGRFFCCAHCARAASGTDAPVDRVG